MIIYVQQFSEVLWNYSCECQFVFFPVLLFILIVQKVGNKEEKFSAILHYFSFLFFFCFHNNLLSETVYYRGK